MNKLLLALLFVLIMVICANAGCVVKYKAPMYPKWEDIEIIDRIQALGSHEQYMARMVKDIQRGAAILVEAGTPVKILERVPPNGLLLEIKGIPVYGYKKYIKCD
jgi:hypothetical protein